MLARLNVELPEKNKTTTINYANAPLRLNGVSHAITLAELYQNISQSFTYSNALFSRYKHAPYLDKKENPQALTQYVFKKFEQHGFTDTSSFVICNMGTLGHGVFADKNFEPGECFILYSGVIETRQSNSAYAFGYSKEVSLVIDAAETGNISRFIQHMPLNFNLGSQSEKEWGEKQITAQDSSDYWQWRNLSYKQNLTENQVAWANLSIIIVPIEDIPCIVFYNTRKINKGEQLGISYGNHYWINRRIKPELFDLNGGIIPNNQYSYAEIIINTPLMGIFQHHPQFKNFIIEKNYTAAMFEQDLQRQQDVLQPVWFSYLAEPISIFKLRELLLQYNAIDKEYEDKENDFVLKLRTILPKDFSIKLFARNSRHGSSKPIEDLVCTTNDLMKWSQLTLLVKQPFFAQALISTKCLKVTQEVIFMDVGNPEKQALLLDLLTTAKNHGIFMQVVAIPSGPSPKDPTSLIQVQSQESIHQILLHNHGMKTEDISAFYKNLEDTLRLKTHSAEASSHAASDGKEIKLNTLTSAFFNHNSPANWKIYPATHLTGKYIGHQVKFFTIPVSRAKQADAFFNVIKQNGFEAELKKSNDKPSIVVDLTISKP